MMRKGGLLGGTGVTGGSRRGPEKGPLKSGNRVRFRRREWFQRLDSKKGERGRWREGGGGRKGGGRGVGGVL